MRKIFLLISVAAALVSCAKIEITPLNSKDVEIALRSDVIDAVSRAPFEGAISADNNLEARVIAGLSNDFSGAAYANGIMIFEGNSATTYKLPLTGGVAVFPNDATTPVYLYGVYPESWAVDNADSGSATITFTGKEDVLAAASISTTKQEVIDGAYKELSFKHLLTRLEVKLSATTVAGSAVEDIQSIKLIGSKDNSTTPVKNSVAITNGDLTTAAFSAGATSTSLDFYKLSLDNADKKVYTDEVVPPYTLTDKETLVAYSLVAPVNATVANEEEYFLEINTLKAGVKRIPVDLVKSDNTTAFEGSTAGRSFTVLVSFRSTQDMVVDAVVVDWDEQGEWKGEIIVD